MKTEVVVGAVWFKVPCWRGPISTQGSRGGCASSGSLMRPVWTTPRAPNVKVAPAAGTTAGSRCSSELTRVKQEKGVFLSSAERPVATVG